MSTARKPSAYVRDFMRAAEEGIFTEVILTAEKIPLKPSKKGGRIRHVQEFIIISTPEFENWNSHYLESENHVRGFPTLEDFVAGKVDLEEAKKRTLDFLQKRRKRSQQTSESIRRKKTQTAE